MKLKYKPRVSVCTLVQYCCLLFILFTFSVNTLCAKLKVFIGSTCCRLTYSENPIDERGYNVCELLATHGHVKSLHNSFTMLSLFIIINIVFLELVEQRVKYFWRNIKFLLLEYLFPHVSQ